jgi:hypothetical protein
MQICQTILQKISYTNLEKEKHTYLRFKVKGNLRSIFFFFHCYIDTTFVLVQPLQYKYGIVASLNAVQPILQNTQSLGAPANNPSINMNKLLVSNRGVAGP